MTSKYGPRPSATFANNEKLGFYIQIYHFALDPLNRKLNGSVEYQVVNNDSHQSVLNYNRGSAVTFQEHLQRVVVSEKLIPLASFHAGLVYFEAPRDGLCIRRPDWLAVPSADFTVIPSAPR